VGAAGLLGVGVDVDCDQFVKFEHVAIDLPRASERIEYRVLESSRARPTADRASALRLPPPLEIAPLHDLSNRAGAPVRCCLSRSHLAGSRHPL
jgi:hypothetical protein